MKVSPEAVYKLFSSEHVKNESPPCFNMHLKSIGVCQQATLSTVWLLIMKQEEYLIPNELILITPPDAIQDQIKD